MLAYDELLKSIGKLRYHNGVIHSQRMRGSMCHLLIEYVDCVEFLVKWKKLSKHCYRIFLNILFPNHKIRQFVNPHQCI